MKKIIIALTVLTATSSMALTVGKVDVQKVLLTIKESESIRTKLKAEFDKKQNEIKKEEEKLVKERADFEKQAMVMNEQTKQKKGQALQQKFMALQQKMQKYQGEMQSMEQDFKAPVLKKIKDVVEEISKAKGVEFTYEAGTTPLLYVKEVVDLTPDVIKSYDKKHK